MNIYISGLSFSANDADLNNLFAEYGEVSSAKVILDRETGKSRGFAFVEMTNDTEGQKAIDELNGVEYDQKVIALHVHVQKKHQTEEEIIITPEDINIQIMQKQKIFCFCIKIISFLLIHGIFINFPFFYIISGISNPVPFHWVDTCVNSLA